MTDTRIYQGSSRTMKRYSTGMMEISFDEYWSAGDKGRSKQPIPGIDASRHIAAMVSFRLTRAAGIPTHFEHELADGFVVKELSVPTHEPLSGMTHGEVLNGEFIWRTYLEGSLWSRVNAGEVDPYDLGFPQGYKPKKGEKLPRMKMECTTKFEPIDRKVGDEEARDLMSMTMADWNQAWLLVSQAVQVTSRVAWEAGYYQPDGKLELGRLSNNGQLIIADTFGTQDENRIIHRLTGDIFSKDIIRGALERLGFNAALKKAQQLHPTDPSQWPDYPTLSPACVETVSLRYRAYANDYEKQAQKFLE